MPSKATNPTNPATIIRRGEGDGRVYLTPDPPRLLATGRRRRGAARCGRGSSLVRIDGGRTQTKRNVRGLGRGIRKPTSPRRRKNTTNCFFCVRVSICSPDRWERKGVTRRTDVEAGQRAGSTGPTRRWQRETARRAVAFVEAKCPAGDVICNSLTGGPIFGPTQKGVHVLGQEPLDVISRPERQEVIHRLCSFLCRYGCFESLLKK